MQEQFNNALEWAKNQNIEGVLTGSSLLGYKENKKQDIDIFCYNPNSFTELIYSMIHNPMFQILDPTELEKLNMFKKTGCESVLRKYKLLTIKFKYNLCIDVNIIIKRGKDNRDKDNIFAVLSSFDLDIICKGFDLKSKQYLDLSQNLPDNKVSFNKWNPKFSDDLDTVNIWNVAELLRQFERVIKYWEYGYDTDLVALKYKAIITQLINKDNPFNSIRTLEQYENIKTNGKLFIKIIDLWLETHIFTEQEKESLTNLIKLMQYEKK